MFAPSYIARRDLRKRLHAETLPKMARDMNDFGPQPVAITNSRPVLMPDYALGVTIVITLARFVDGH